MKYTCFLLILTCFITSSCSQQNNAFFDTQTTENLNIPPIIAFQINQNFLTDYPIYGKQTLINGIPSVMTQKYLTKYRTEEELLSLYPEIKRDIQTNPDETSAIQSLALNFLRTHFLKDDSQDALNETKFLLKTLIEHHAVDLDVLADAFVKVKERLTEKDRQAYYKYLSDLYYSNKQHVKENYSSLKEQYENATDKDKIKFLMHGKELERVSKSGQYSNDLLKFENNS